jgi:hypothetical protein
MKPRLLVVLGLVTAALGAGCGGTTTTVETVTTKQPPSTSTSTVSQPERTETVHTSSPTGPGNHEGPGTVPDETHVRLDVAERDLARRGVSYTVVGVGASGLGAKSHWTVCETNPSPRTHLESGTTIRLIVGRSCQPGKR